MSESVQTCVYFCLTATTLILMYIHLTTLSSDYDVERAPTNNNAKLLATQKEKKKEFSDIASMGSLVTVIKRL